jgi:hypothetical protein
MTRSPTFRTTTSGPITNRKLGTDRLLNFVIPLPPREEQEVIVELDRNLRQQSEEFARFADQTRAALAEVMPALLAQQPTPTPEGCARPPDGRRRKLHHVELRTR